MATFARNVRHSFDTNFRREVRVLQSRLRYLELQNAIVQHYSWNDPGDLAAEVEHVRRHGWGPFPYSRLKEPEPTERGWCRERRMAYVVHKGKRLYFPKGTSAEMAEHEYRYLTATEQLLGGGYLERAPHCYQREGFAVEEGDVVVDAGSAEGLFALDAVERAAHVYLVEASRRWMPALKATFEPWKGKVTIVNKYLSTRDSRHHVSLPGLLAAEAGRPVFVKMDIEGHEVEAVGAAKEWLAARGDVKMACCAYHRHGDAEALAALFDSIGYRHEFSEGWMLFNAYDDPQPPFFRHGLVRACRRPSDERSR